MIICQASSAPSSMLTATSHSNHAHISCLDFICHANGVHGFGFRVSFGPHTDTGFMKRDLRPRAEFLDDRKFGQATQEKADEQGALSVWDSNAESIRRSWRQKRASSSDFGLDEGRGRASNEGRGRKGTDTKNDRQWWRSNTDDDDYEEDMDDDDEDNDSYSWLNFDVDTMLATLRWILPAAVVVLPWLSGGPMFLMVAFTFFSVAQRLTSPVLPGIMRAVSRLWRSSSSSKRKQRRQTVKKMGRKSSSRGSTRSGWTIFDPSLDDLDDDLRERGYMKNDGWASISAARNQGQSSELGGWDDLEEENAVAAAKVIKTSKDSRLRRRPRRREVPLFLRFLIALFPFLRTWGGFL